MLSRRLSHVLGLFLVLAIAAAAARSGAGGEEPALRVAVLDDAPPMAYRDADGQLTGFSHAVAQAVCSEMKRRCDFVVTKLDYLVDELAAGNYDFAAIGLLATRERRQKILFSQPFYRSLTLWFGPPQVPPWQRGLHVSTFRGSAQERYAQGLGLLTVGAQNESEMVEQLTAGVAHAAVVPLMTSFSLQKNQRFMALGLVPTPVLASELEGSAAFGINPRRADLKAPIDRALEAIRRNGVYDRINTRFLPFRVN